MERNDDGQLGAIIRTVKRPILSADRKFMMKNRIMNRINQPVVISIKTVVSDFVLDAGTRAVIKERVFSSIEKNVWSKFTWSNFFIFNKKFVSSMLLFVMVFSFAAFVNVDMNVVRAQSFTVLDSFDGDVVVERSGVPLRLEPGMKILEDDRVATGKNGKATIKFFDDSVTRLAEDTTIGIDSLVRPDNSSVRSYVEVDLNRGTLWGNVLALEETNSSFVIDASVAKLTTQKAAFNVSVDAGEVSVGVFDNEVTVESDKDDKVASGEKIVLKPSERSVRVEKIDDRERDLAWIKDNLDDDKEYVLEVEKRLLAAKAESVGFDPDDELSEDISLRESTVLFLTFNDVKKKKKELDLAEKKFVAAQVKLASGELDDGDLSKVDLATENFSKKVQEFGVLVDDVATTDEEYAGELEVYLSDKILANKKDLSLVLPTLAVSKEGEVVEKEPLVEVVAAPEVVSSPPSLDKIDWERKPVAVEPEVDKLKEDAETYNVEVVGDKPVSPLFNIE